MVERGKHLFDRLAHDLRGPLAPLQTASYLLRRGNVAANRQQELLGIIDRQAARLGCMVQELGDWHCASQGRLRLREDITELGILLGLACDGLTGGQVVQLELPADIDNAGISGDAQRLAQMFTVLLSYAGSRAIEGGVRVVGTRGSGELLVQIRYRRLGAANTAASHTDVFKHPQETPYDGGLGWQLMIADAIAKAHQLNLRMETSRAQVEAEHAEVLVVGFPLDSVT